MNVAHRSGAPSVRLACLLLVAAVSLFWAVALLGHDEPRALDAFEYHYPSYTWLYGEIAQGRLPLWNVHQLCGIPTVDTLQNGAFYPPHILYVLLPTDVAMAISGWLHLLLAAVATFAFAIRAGLGPGPALLAGLLVATRGAQPGHIANPSMQEAGAWIAVGFIGVLAAARGRPIHGASWIALAAGMSLLAGFPQSSVYSAYAWGVGAIGLGLAAQPGWRRPALASAAVFGGVGLGALIAMVVLLPALDLSAIGSRTRGVLSIELMLPYGRVGFETLAEAWRFISVSRPAAPDLLGPFGVVGLALAALGLWPGPSRRVGIVMLCIAALSLAFALGPATPLFDVLIRLPELGAFRSPWRVLFVADFALAIAAAVGATAMLSFAGHRSARASSADPATEGARPLARGATIGKMLVGAAVALAFAEALLAPAATPRLPYDAGDRDLALHHEERPSFARLGRGHDRVFTIFGGNMNGVSEKLASTRGFRSVSDNEILTLRRQREYFTWLYWGDLEPDARGATGFSERIFYGHYDLVAPGIDAEGVVSRSRLLDLAAARTVVASRSVIGQPPVHTFILGTRLRPVDVRDDDVIVFENARALPRAYLSAAVAEAPPTEELLTAISSPGFDPRARSFVETGGAPLPALGPAAVQDHVEWLEDAPERVRLESFTAAPALVVLADAFHPDWVAEVDGVPVAILATNQLFRGVVVPAGEHEVVFRYEPRALRLGAALSGLGVVLLVGVALWLRGREPRDDL